MRGHSLSHILLPFQAGRSGGWDGLTPAPPPLSGEPGPGHQAKQLGRVDPDPRASPDSPKASPAPHFQAWHHPPPLWQVSLALT